MLITTVDHEVFGNGSGCLDACVINPLNQMMETASGFEAPLTIFVEALEYMAMEEAGIQGVDMIANQLSTAVREGHNLQLHIHPQWLGARYQQNGLWSLSMDKWRIGDVGREPIRKMLGQGKSWISRLTLEAESDIGNCIAFRAGGWCIQPSDTVIQELNRIGIQIDSSVAPSLRSRHSGQWYDFRTVPELPFWKVEKDVCCASQNGLCWEIPIVTGKVTSATHMRALRASKKSGNFGLATNCKGSYVGPGGRIDTWFERVGKVLQLGYVMLDISTMSADILIELTMQWRERFGFNNSLPLVAIAHTKNFTPRSNEEMRKYLHWVQESGIPFGTFGDWMKTHASES